MSDEKKGCGCNKQKKEFSDTPMPEKGKLVKALSMIQGYSIAMASRGMKDKKVDKPLKQLRVLSCFGNQDTGGELPPCVHLKKSSTDGKFYCGGCGCGDKKSTWLNSSDEEYSKLDYPSLNCPIGMPGFSNYKTSEPKEAEEPQSRKHYIENIDFKSLSKVDVTLPEPPPEVVEIMKKLEEMKIKKLEDLRNNRPTPET